VYREKKPEKFDLKPVAEPGGGRRGLSPLQKGLSPPLAIFLQKIYVTVTISFEIV
jgi:hypothetical protein